MTMEITVSIAIPLPSPRSSITMQVTAASSKTRYIRLLTPTTKTRAHRLRLLIRSSAHRHLNLCFNFWWMLIVFHCTKYGKQTNRSWAVYRAAYWTKIYYSEFHGRMVIRVPQALRSTGPNGLDMENYPAKEPVDEDV